MITVLMTVHKKKEAAAYLELFRYCTALEGDEELTVNIHDSDIDSRDTKKESIPFCGGFFARQIPDIILFEIRFQEDISRLKEMRGCFPEAELIVIVGRNIPVESYLNCDVRPSEAVFRPVDKKSFINIFHRIYGALCRRREKGQDTLAIKTGTGIRYLRYSHIPFIEAREKKLHIYYGEEEVTFYGSLTYLEKHLPPCFLRCHRGYIINTSHISGMDVSRGILYLRQEYMIPVSQKYKKSLHDKMKKTGNFNQSSHKGQTRDTAAEQLPAMAQEDS